MCIFTDSEVLLIGPGLGSDGKSEVRSLPDLSPLDCNLPVFPDGSYWGYVGRYTSDGVQMCGGQTSKEYVTSSCYLLTSSGYKPMQGLLNPRKGAASIETPLGWWVTGKPVVMYLGCCQTQLKHILRWAR